MRLNDKVSIVTGASRGLGKGIAVKLAKEGSKVILADVLAATDTYEEITAQGRTAFVYPVNITKSDEVEKLIAFTLEKFGALDILVNNAGINRDGILHKMSEDQWNEVINVNLTGTFLCTREALKFMRSKGYGRIINISSGSWLGNIGQANYAASKAGVVGLTKTAARENAKKGVTCNVICPGFIETDMTLRLKEVNNGAAWDSMMGRIPMGYAGKPSDVANLVAFLASDEAAYITAEVINVGGGMIV